MTRSDHDEFDGLAVGWALHALEPDEEHAFADHLSTCQRCKAAVHQSEEALGELAYDVPLVDPPPQLLDRIRLATGATDMPSARFRISSPAAADEPEKTGEPSRSRVAEVTLLRRLRRNSWAPLTMAAAAVLIALLSWNVVLHDQAGHARRVAAQRQAVIAKLTDSSTKVALQDGAGKIIGYVLQRGTGVDVVSDGLAPNNRATTTYVLWAVQESGKPPQAVGTFDVVRKDLDVRTVAGHAPLSDFSAFAVSRELGRTSPDRPSQVVATGAVPG
ncbi:MAG: anti-sigma factor [Pseudonocardiales bacterium]